MDASGKSALSSRGEQDLTEEERRAAIDNFVELFYRNGGSTWRTTTWAGVPAFKLPLDLWVMQEIVFETRPELIIETGVAAGGSTLFFAHLLDLIGGGSVIGVDIDLSQVSDLARSHPRVSLLEASSSADEAVARLRAAAQGKRTMVLLDSDHSAAHVSSELNQLADLVSPGCYLIVEDTTVNGNPVEPDFGPGPGEALAAWLDTGAPFEIDASRERLLASFNPGGYLRRRGELPEPPATDPDGAPETGRNGDGEPAAADLLRRLQQAEREREELRAQADDAVHARQDAAALEVRIAALQPEVDSTRAALRRSAERVRELRGALVERQNELEREKRRTSWVQRERDVAQQRSDQALIAKQRELEAVSVRLEGIRASVPMRAYDRLRSLPPISWVSKRRARRHRLAWQASERDRLDREGESAEA